MASATERGQWRLVRQRRARRALAALQDGRANDALQELNHPGAVGDETAETLAAVAAVMATQTLSDASRCVALLERYRDGRYAAEAFEVATRALEPVLRIVPGASWELIAHVAQLTGRLMQVAGALPWGFYNLAVYAMQTGQFGLASRYLAAGATAPAGSWPPVLLGAACAAAFGDPASLARCLSSAAVDAHFAQDFRFFRFVAGVFECLRDDRPVQDVEFGAVLGEASGSLVRTIPQLSALKSVLAAAIHGGPPRVPQTALEGCAWGQWLCGRLRYAEDEATAVLSDHAPERGQPALIWQRLGNVQDLRPLLSAEAAQALPAQLADFGARFTDGTAWGRLVELRIALSEDSSTAAAASRSEPSPCPWWPVDGCLQRVAAQEQAVERGYLEARLALRAGQTDAALEWFARARPGLTGRGLVARLVRLRYEPLLDYWEGVTFAHAGQTRQAAEFLQRCEHGVKAREARAQLGLLAVAAGENTEAAQLLETISAPRPASADYLAALLAGRSGEVQEAERLVDGFAGREAAAGAYVAAGHRMLGRLHEVNGEVTEATRRYRQALTNRPADPVAAARLARVWLRQRYDGAEIPPEPLLDSSSLERTWAAPLLVVRDCLDGVTGEPLRALLDPGPADPVLRLLVARRAVEAGEDAVGEALQTWAADGDPDLVRAALSVRASRLIREFCLAEPGGSARAELVALEEELRSEADDPVLAFWAGTAKLLLHPESAAEAPPLPTMEDDSRSGAVRLLSGLLSVFAADPQQRELGARHARRALETQPVAHAAIRCLIADALGEDGEFLAAYGEIEEDLLTLPCAPVAGYLAATEARLRTGNLDAVIDGHLPDELADLANPEVRRAMGIAYARRAVRSSERDIRRALRDIDQARTLLQEQA
ncbi:hypothetical protein [Saccharopolyspora sp. NPDC002686]|uniref:tetratricopeptide repeat protein n=1 Tax=Saccharopolyspora sp. NPDC002686 TaxID=3154541 RepID=UPI00331C4DC0